MLLLVKYKRKKIISPRDEETISCELSNFELQFSKESLAKSKRNANLREQEQTQLPRRRTNNLQTGM